MEELDAVRPLAVETAILDEREVADARLALLAVVDGLLDNKQQMM